MLSQERSQRADEATRLRRQLTLLYALCDAPVDAALRLLCRYPLDTVTLTAEAALEPRRRAAAARRAEVSASDAAAREEAHASAAAEAEHQTNIYCGPGTNAPSSCERWRGRYWQAHSAAIRAASETRSYRGVAHALQRTHPAHTSQRTHRGLTEDSQRTHTGFTKVSQRTCPRRLC